MLIKWSKYKQKQKEHHFISVCVISDSRFIFISSPHPVDSSLGLTGRTVFTYPYMR